MPAIEAGDEYSYQIKDDRPSNSSVRSSPGGLAEESLFESHVDRKEEFIMPKFMTAGLMAAFGLCFSGAVLAQNVQYPSPDAQTTSQPQREQQEREPAPTTAPDAVQEDREFIAAMKKCFEQSGPEQDQCIAQAKERFGRM